jgi:hypothetical protein
MVPDVALMSLEPARCICDVWGCPAGWRRSSPSALRRARPADGVLLLWRKGQPAGAFGSHGPSMRVASLSPGQRGMVMQRNWSGSTLVQRY